MRGVEWQRVAVALVNCRLTTSPKQCELLCASGPDDLMWNAAKSQGPIVLGMLGCEACWEVSHEVWREL